MSIIINVHYYLKNNVKNIKNISVSKIILAKSLASFLRIK